MLLCRSADCTGMTTVGGSAAATVPEKRIDLGREEEEQNPVAKSKADHQEVNHILSVVLELA